MAEGSIRSGCSVTAVCRILQHSRITNTFTEKKLSVVLSKLSCGFGTTTGVQGLSQRSDISDPQRAALRQTRYIRSANAWNKTRKKSFQERVHTTSDNRQATLTMTMQSVNASMESIEKPGLGHDLSTLGGGRPLPPYCPELEDFVVTFDEGDPSHPQNWTTWNK